MKQITCVLGIILTCIFFGCQNFEKEKRKEISLNGNWQIAKTDIGMVMTKEFTSTCPVPGLVDMASPKIDGQDTAYHNSVYWYKKLFKLDGSDVSKLKINMAKYHTKVYLNKQFVGENVYNFTASYFDLKPFLNGNDQENELIISVGCRNNLPDTVINGHDFEKMKYIPGIYDDVKIISTGYPYLSNVQTIPDIEEGTVRVVAEVEKKETGQPVSLRYVVREAVSKKIVSEGNFEGENSAGLSVELDFTAKLSDVKLWSPESPFLYELVVETKGDKYSTKFGMRTFTVNPEGGAYLLNGKPYYMRGTNVCILRFFEDPDRDGLPWDDQWATKLHNRFKEMNWNSIRYCIGFPPERWYEIADSLGFLIQDEYPIWTLEQNDSIYPNVTAEQLANEFRAWLPEHWNHPCVVIWDAQNESDAPFTTEAVKMVRDMDLSNRMWENGWSYPANPQDPTEAHPYLFIQYWHEGQPSEKGPLSDFLNEVRFPRNSVNDHQPPKDGDCHPNPVIINEYAWLWLNRDGSTTTLTDRVYDVSFGTNLAAEQRIDIYTKHLAMLTEYWRAHRLCAGVLHFCGLGYSRPEEPRGQTSDHFIDIKNLTYEPNFVKQVKPAFSPVGLMINFWELTVKSGQEHQFEVYAINDLDTGYQGTLKLVLQKDKQEVSTSEQEIVIEPYGRAITNMAITVPSDKGKYKLSAEIKAGGETVKSTREFEVN